MDILVNLPDAYIARLNDLVDTMNASQTRREASPIWTAESTAMVALIRGIEEVESRYV